MGSRLQNYGIDAEVVELIVVGLSKCFQCELAGGVDPQKRGYSSPGSSVPPEEVRIEIGVAGLRACTPR